LWVNPFDASINNVNRSYFFTNEPDSTLLDRFKATLKHTQYFDVLVGYFRSSGFHLLYDSFEEIEKVRILVGLNVGVQTYEIIDMAGQSEFDFDSHKKVKDKFSENLSQEIEISEDTVG